VAATAGAGFSAGVVRAWRGKSVNGGRGVAFRRRGDGEPNCGSNLNLAARACGDSALLLNYKALQMTIVVFLGHTALFRPGRA